MANSLMAKMFDSDGSFIILGSTPNASMEFGESMTHHQQPQALTLNGPSSTKKPSLQVATNKADNLRFLIGSNTQNQQNGQASVAATETLNGSVPVYNSIANRFLCGEVHREMQMQNLISDNKSLKDNLEESNKVLRRHFSMVQTLNDKLTAENLTLKKQIIDNAEKYYAEKNVMNAAHHKQIIDMKRLFDKYENENNKILHQELIDTAETFKINFETMRLENDELVKQNSDKLSIIKNLSSQMEKLKLQPNQAINGREMDHDLSELKVNNIQLEDTVKEQSEEIERLLKCLQNALDSDEQVRTDLARLKAENLANQKLLADKDKLLKGTQAQVVVLATQVGIYRFQVSKLTK